MLKKTKGQRGRWRTKFRVPPGAEWWFTIFFILLDAFVMNQIFLGVFEIWLYGVEFQEKYLEAYFNVRWWLFGLFTVFGFLFDIFSIRALRAASDILSGTMAALLSTFIGFNLLIFFSRSIGSLAHTFPRPIILLSTALSIFGIFFVRVLVTRLFKPHPLIKRAVIVGDENEGKRILKHFQKRGGMRFRLLGTFTGDRIDELAPFVIFRLVHEVIVTDPKISLNEFWASIFFHRKEEPHFFRVRVANDPATTVANIGLISLEDLPLTTLPSLPLTPFQRALKRGFDIIFSIFAIMVSSPAMILAAIIIPINSKGPVFYKQKRSGRYGKDYELYKFRSMHIGAEKGVGPKIAVQNDPRMTSIGGFLRRFGIDELPQFFHVLTGEMSVVGPRPERPFFVQKHLEFQGRRLSVRPGVTGLAAVNARYYLRLTDKVTYDYYYLDHYSLILDIKIVFQTIWVLIFESDKALEDQHHRLDKMDQPPPEEENKNEEDK